MREVNWDIDRLVLVCFNIHIVEPRGSEMSVAQCVAQYGVEASMVMQWTVNPPAYATPGSIPGYSTKLWGQ